MTLSEIVEKFELQVDDASELSTAEAYDLANNVYTEIQNDRDWEWLKATATGTTSTTVAYVALPADFRNIAPNKDGRSVVFVGTDYQEYTVIPFSSRRDYRDQDGYCYIDIPNQRLYFTLQPTSAKAIEYDYIKIAPTLTASTSPLMRIGMHQIISIGMAAKFNPIELTDKTNSYRNENIIEYSNLLHQLALEDARIKLSI